jgi:hypothetical protein
MDNAKLAAQYRTMTKLANLSRDAAEPPPFTKKEPAEAKALLNQQRRLNGAIGHAGTLFLKSKGYKGNGFKKGPRIPGL